MKNNFVEYGRFSLATFALLFVAVAGCSVQAQKQSADRIVGAWETTVTPTNCISGEPIAPAFPGVITFNEGGTVAEFGANPGTPYRTPGHGIWVSNGGEDYTMKFSFIPLNQFGAPVGRLRVTQSLQLAKFSDESSTSGGFVLTNLAGAVIATGCSTSTAVRVTL
ncbi:MAG: hypothetical protein PSX80_13840 [bacterium]|nr:hypothetical protein [bacterium]